MDDDALDEVVWDWVGDEPTDEDVAGFASFAAALEAVRAMTRAIGTSPCQAIASNDEQAKRSVTCDDRS